MKVLALSDIHSEERVIDGLRSLLIRNKYDAVFLVGDISDHNNVLYVESLLSLLENIPTCIIPGNMDDVDVRERLSKEEYYIDLKKITFKNKYEMYGIGGGLRGPFNTPYEYTEEEILPKIENVRIKNPSIILSHCPPFGYFDEVGGDVHIGSRSVLKFMYANEPFILLCGHVHETKGHIKIGNTNVIKLGPAKKGDAAEIKLNYVSNEKNTVEINWIKLF